MTASSVPFVRDRQQLSRKPSLIGLRKTSTCLKSTIAEDKQIATMSAAAMDQNKAARCKAEQVVTPGSFADQYNRENAGQIRSRFSTHIRLPVLSIHAACQSPGPPQRAVYERPGISKCIRHSERKGVHMEQLLVFLGLGVYALLFGRWRRCWPRFCDRRRCR